MCCAADSFRAGPDKGVSVKTIGAAFCGVRVRVDVKPAFNPCDQDGRWPAGLDDAGGIASGFQRLTQGTEAGMFHDLHLVLGEQL